MLATASELGLETVLAALFAGYLLGSIPFGLIITRLAGLGDIRAIGSGNIGTTNVLRTGRRELAALTLLGDFGKGLAAVLIANAWETELGLIAGFGAFLGHLYPAWLKFKGGKGVATYLGVLAGVTPLVAVIFAAIWVSVAYLTRYSSLSALIASAATPVILAALQYRAAIGLFTVLTILIFLRHHANLSRLVKGEEGKIGGGSG